MRQFTILMVAGAVAILAVVLGTSMVSADQSRSVEITQIEAGCDSAGEVFGKSRLFNESGQDQVVNVTLTLTQHVPPSRGGAPNFFPVPGQEKTFELVAFAGEEAAFTFTFSTLGVDPRANSLRVESSGLNPERSESFGPCEVPTLPPPVSATPVPPAEMLTPTPTYVSAIGPPMEPIGPEPTPTVPVVVRLPETGVGPGHGANSAPLLWRVVGFTTIGVSLVGIGWMVSPYLRARWIG